jgi:hypothetical protein
MARERIAVQLSQKFFARITGVHLDAAGTHPASVDRRQHPRIPFDRRARIFPLMEGASETGSAILIRDISVSGIGFLHADPISVGDEFVVRLYTPDDQPIDLQCAARRCEMSGTCQSQFAVGATFELVLNMPLSEAVAPESEIIEPDTEMVDQPSSPTIEQRYDIQCVTSRQIRPIIRQTRLDHWLARPTVKKITRILSLVLWPVLFLCQRIRSLIPAREGSRIRSRLSATKLKRKRRAKKSASPAAVIAPPTPPAQPSPEIDAPLMKMLHPALFHNAQPKHQPPSPATLSVPVDPNRKSIFSSARIEPAQLPVLPPQVEAIAPTPAPSIEQSPVQPAIAPAPALIVAEPIIEVLPPTPALEPIQMEARPAPQPEPVIEVATPAPAPEPLQVEQRPAPLPQPAPVSHEIPSLPASQPRECRNEQPEIPAKPRPPVAHPRQMRRRPRPSYYR